MSITDLSVRFSAFEILPHRTITFSKFAQNLKPHLFWRQVSQNLSQNPHCTHVYLKNSGMYERCIFETYITLGINIPASKIAHLTRKLKKLHFSFDQVSNEGLPPLHQAIIAGRTDLVMRHVYPHISQQDSKGRTALQWAVYLGNAKIAKFLLAKGAELSHAHPITGLGFYHAMRGKSLRNLQIPLKFKFSNIQTQALNENLSNIDSHISIVATALNSIKEAQNPIAKQKFQRILNSCANPLLLRQYLQLEKYTKDVSHMWQIPWDESICYLGDQRPIHFSVMSGGHEPYYLNKMAKTTSQFRELFADSHDFNLPVLPQLEDALSFAAKSDSFTDKEILDRYHEGKPILLPIYFPFHYVTVLLIGEYFVICNGGQEASATTEIYNFNPAHLTEKVISLLTSPIQSASHYRQLLFFTIAKRLSFQKSDNELLLEKLLDAPKQQTSNCSWHNPKIAVYTLFMLHMIQNIPHFSFRSRLDEQYIARMINRRTIVFLNWDLLQRLTSLQKLLEHRAPHFVTNNTLLPSVVKKFQSIQKQSWPHEKLLAMMHTMRSKHPLLV